MSSTNRNIIHMDFKVTLIDWYDSGKKELLECLGIPFRTANIGDAYLTKSYIIEGKKINLNIWNPLTNAGYEPLIPIFAEDASAIVILYSISNQESVDSIDRFLNLLNGINSTIYLVGNESDENSIVFTSDQGREKANSIGSFFYEISTLRNKNIVTLFSNIATFCYNSKKT